MILNASGVVLWRRKLGECDRIAGLYTDELGRVAVRFGGVEKPAAKLKALSEPMTWGEYRLHLGRSEHARAVGGRIIDSFPSVRADLGRTMEALACCELLGALTPERDPSREKFILITDALTALSRGAAAWVVAAFGLQLLDLAGFRSLEDAAEPQDRPVWRRLHEARFFELGELPADPERERRLTALVCGQAERLAGREMKSMRLSPRLEVPEREAALSC